MNDKESGAVLMNMAPFVLCRSKKTSCYAEMDIEKMQVQDIFNT